METKEEKTDRPVNTHHGHAIARLRRVQGLSQKQLGELVYMVQQTVSSYEEKKEIDEEILERFAKALKVPVNLIKELEEETPLIFYVENNNVTNENSPGNKINVGTNDSDKNNETTNNYTDKALYTALEQIQKLYENSIQLYNQLLQTHREKIASLQERIASLENEISQLKS